MQHIPLTGENAKIAAKWKKKLFIAGAYLAVSFALLILVSYGQYRIRVEGAAYMPEAAGIEASLELDKNLAATLNCGSYLTDLQPGDSARTYASAYSTNEGDATALNQALNHKMQVTIKNSSTMTTGEGDDQTTTTVASDLGLDYTLRIFSTPGRIPMQFIMIDGSNNKYISKRQSDGKEYRFYLISGSGNNETEVEFTLPASNTAGNTYQIFAGWDNTAEDATSLTDAAFRKEVELLELRAEVVAGTTQSAIPEESVLQSAIPTPTPSPSPSPTPTPPPVPTEPVG